MNIKMDFKDWNMDRSDIKYLVFITIISTLLVAYMIDFNLKLGIYCSDVLIYLTNSLRFAGVNLGYGSDMSLSPVICFLSSLLIRLGLKGEISIYIITGIFAIIGNLGLYCLLKVRFDSLLSLTGAILFSSFSLNVLWLANGTLDIPAVAVSIWAIFFTIIASKNSVYYILAIPLWVIAVFTRYTALLMFAFMVLYYLFEKDFIGKVDLLFSRKISFEKKKSQAVNYFKSDEFKSIFKGCLISIILILIFVIAIHLFGSRLTFLSQSSSIASGSKGSVIDNAYSTDTFFYIHDFLNFLYTNKVIFSERIPNLVGVGPLAYLIGIILVSGLFKGAIDFFKTFSLKRLINENGTYSHRYLSKKCLLSYLILSLLLVVLSFSFNSLVSIIFLLIFSIVLYALLVNLDGYLNNGLNGNLTYSSNQKLNVLFFAWFFSYLIFFTFLDIKVNRYIITALPAFVYFFILALEYLLDYIEKLISHSKSKFNLQKIIPIILIILAIFAAFSFAGNVEIDDTIKSPEIMADYLIHYDDNYSSKEVAVYNTRYYNWLLKMNTIPLEDKNIDYLEESNITYYISDNPWDLKNYDLVHKENNLYLYKHK